MQISGQAAVTCIALLTVAAPIAVATVAEEDQAWTGGLRAAYFEDRAIETGDTVISLDVPRRAADAALVPVSIRAGIEQTDEHYIRTIYLIVDRNPQPMIGKFHFSPRNGRADLDLRIRVDSYTPVRAVAETNTGELYMSRRFVKASGGCSAPAPSDMDAIMSRLGEIRIRTNAGDAATSAQLLVSHPNLSGLQMDQLTRLYAPAHFVRDVVVTYAGETVFRAETSFGISENPSFRFQFVPETDGELVAEITDTKDLRFDKTIVVGSGVTAQR